MPEQKFKTNLNFFSFIFKEAQFLFWLIVFFIVVLVCASIFSNFVTNSILLLILTIISPIVIIFLSIALILIYLTNINVIVLNDEGLSIPDFSSFGYALMKIDEEGYCYDSKNNSPVVLSSYNNISRVWKVIDQKEKDKIKSNKNLYNLKFSVKVGGVSVNVKNLPSVVGDYKENKPLYNKLIQEGFLHYYVSDENYAVGIKFKNLSLQVFSFIPDRIKNSETNQNFIKIFYPNLKNQIIYVSVKNPDELVEEIKSRMH